VLRTGVLIVTHNSASHIGPCLDALEGVCGDQVLLLVIDNCSEDGTLESAAAHRSLSGRGQARVIANESNAGFAGAVNQGFELLKDEVDAVLLLNPDVILKTPLDDLATACQRAGLAGGRLTGADGKPQVGFSFRRFPTPLTLLFETIGLNRMWKTNPINRSYRCLNVDHEVPATVDQPAGAMLMIRNDVWIRLNGMDEQFHPVWFEDVDFCRRAALAGFQATYVPSVEGRHEGGHSVLQIPDSSRRRYWYASLMRYSRKHFGRTGWALVAGGVRAATLVRSVGAVLRGRKGSVAEDSDNGMIARKALVYPAIEPEARNLKVVISADAANVRSRVLNEGNPSKENTERTLKRLHAR